MTQFFVVKETEIVAPEDIIPFLAKQKDHWKEKYSAYELAYSWVSAKGFPDPIRRLLDACPDYRGAELVEGFFEREVDLRTPGRRSQTDLMALIRTPSGPAALAVEGKVEESFGPLVSEWRDKSAGKEKRLQSLCQTLGLDPEKCGKLRYQLFHRAVSAIYEAQRHRYDQAMMLVHSFSPKRSSFPDFVAFTEAMGVAVTEPGTVSAEIRRGEIRLRFAWCADQARD